MKAKHLNNQILTLLLIPIALMGNFILSQQLVLSNNYSPEGPLGGPVLAAQTTLEINNGAQTQTKIIDSTDNKGEIALEEKTAALQSVNSFIISKKSESNDTGYFKMPTTGWNWGRLHNQNAVDVANNCGTPIYAAAEGLITESASDGWNSGYGKYIKIKHPNNTETLYSHNNENVILAGQYVEQGDLIAYMGNTGNTHGPTGCHLHFEVRGAKNPLAK